MSTSNTPRRMVRRVHRRHTLNKEQVDSLPWPHPRPARDWRLIGVHLALIWTSVGQIVFGPPMASVQYRVFGYAATIAFGALMLFLSGLFLTAAFCKSQYASFGYETAACLGFVGALGIYAILLAASTPEWALTYNWSFTVALVVGNAVRGWILFRRIW